MHFEISKTRIRTDALISIGFLNVITFVAIVIGIFVYGAQYLIRWIFMTYFCHKKSLADGNELFSEIRELFVTAVFSDYNYNEKIKTLVQGLKKTTRMFQVGGIE